MIIAITGVKRAGKDTAADYLIRTYINHAEHLQPDTRKNLAFTRYAFAFPLKTALRDLYGWELDIWESKAKDEVDEYWGISPRQAAQMLGTEWSQMLSETFPQYEKITQQRFLVKRFLQEAEDHPENNYIITDLRFQYEVDALCEHARNTSTIVTFLRIQRPEVEQDISLHKSEQEVLSLDVDAMIINDGTLQELYDNLDIFANSLKLARKEHYL